MHQYHGRLENVALTIYDLNVHYIALRSKERWK